MIKVINLESGYQKKPVLKKLCLEFKEGEFCSILGPNGAGKSTLLKTLLKYVRILKGNVLVKGKDLTEYNQLDLAKVISIIPQDYVFIFDYSVEEAVVMGRFPYLSYFANYSKFDWELTLEILESLDLYEFRKKKISQLSGGERQRAIIARSLVQETEVILMDEALSHVDINHQLDIMELLARINQEKKKLIVFISHNINLSVEYCDRLIFLKNGTLFGEGDPKDMVREEIISELFSTRIKVTRNPFSGKPNIIYRR